MKDSSETLSVATIHSVYAGKKATPATDEAKGFRSTNRFARDPSHSGQAPQPPKMEKGPFRR